MKTYLDVPFEQKETVKRLGAQWDLSAKKWFVPDAVDLQPFFAWVPGMPKLSKKVKRELKKAV